MALNSNIIIFKEEEHINTKASEEYVHVKFIYPEDFKEWDGWIPIKYRRTGVSISVNDEITLEKYLNDIYIQMDPSKYGKWLEMQNEYWSTKPRSKETREIFNILKDGKWHCRNCDINNANFARRIQDLKEMGYTISTHINYHCPICNNNRSTRLCLLPIDRVQLSGNGYETWSRKLRKRIIDVLGSIDVYENRVDRNCLPDHKFPEIRWDNDTKSINPENMSDQEIRNKFQLLTNQRNQQKREVCRKCFQTGVRGTIYGITFFYEGGKYWNPNIPDKGKKAEQGCIGCPWYDIEEWRKQLLIKMNNSYNK